MSEGRGTKSIRERVEDAMREIGTLLIAFTPLDVSLTETPHRGTLLIFLVLGLSFLTGALLLERSRTRVA